MSEQAIDGLTLQTAKLVKAYERLKRENSQLKKQLAVAEMEQAHMREKHSKARAKIDSLIQQLTHLEGQQ